MKKVSLGIHIMVVGLLAFATGARAETISMVANIGHDFVASGQTHSAGIYKLSRLTPETLLLQCKETGESVVLLPSMYDYTLSGQRPALKLRLTGDVYYLTEVVTASGVYSLRVSHDITHHGQ